MRIASAYSSHSRVLPSMSVNRNVTDPVGGPIGTDATVSALTTVLIPCSSDGSLCWVSNGTRRADSRLLR